jgi:ppGpp synthetase/RelA/SpoT-type nucleotidyltranferase
MNLKNRMIMEEYREAREDFVALGDIVSQILRASVREQHIEVFAVEHRVKAEDSLAGKLELKGDKYASLRDITDILGARVICYFSDDVDAVAEIIEQLFEIDRENSVDKRAQLRPDAFGYLSLHYICALPDNGSYPKNVCGKKFEIQIRSILQHTWAAINHDLGYKSEFGVPKQITREFSRVAGLLEIADKEFVEIRDNIHKYGDETRTRIANNEAGEIQIDLVSLNEYMKLNHTMGAFLEQIAGFCHAEISYISPEVYIEQLRYLGKQTLGDLQRMLEEDGDFALKLAAYSLEKTDLDILSSNVGLRYLCRAELVLKGYTQEQAEEFIAISVGDRARAKKQAERLFAVSEKLGAAEATSAET